MEPQNITLAVAFGAGILSFVSPCVLPLVPAYLGHLGGVAVGAGGAARTRRTLGHAALFVLGFATVFVGIWASIGLLGSAIPALLPAVRQIGGVLLIVMGLHVMGVFRIPLLYREKRFQLGMGHTPSPSFSFLVGLIFAAGWTPCIGPILGGIIGLATLSDTVAHGTYLLAAYAAGLGVPFLLAALSLEWLTRVARGVRRYYAAIEIASGAFLIAVGVLMLTNMFVRLPQYFTWGAV